MDPGGLGAYLEQKRAAMAAAAAARPGAEQWRETVEATVTAGDLTGVRRLRIRGWELISDSGPAFGGWALGPSSPELLCGVLGTCLTHTYEITAASMGIGLQRIAIRVTANNNDAGLLGLATDDPPLPWGITAHVDIEAPDVPAASLAELHRLAAERCPLTNLIRRGAPVAIEVSQ